MKHTIPTGVRNQQPCCKWCGFEPACSGGTCLPRRVDPVSCTFAGLALTLALSLVVTLWTVSLSAQPTPIFSMDCKGGAAYPACGWPDTKRETSWTRTLRVGASPSGGDAVEFRLTPDYGPAGRQYSIGWGTGLHDALPARQGDRRYIRYRVRVLSPINWAGAAGGGQRNVGGKTVDFGSGCDGPGGTTLSRVISSLGPEASSGPFDRIVWGTSRNIEGRDSGIFFSYDPTGSGLSAGTWYNFQLEMRSSSTADAKNGSLKLWVNNNTYGRPSAGTAGYVLRVDNWSGATRCGVSFGGTLNSTLVGGGTAIFQLADFVLDDEFDSTWHMSTIKAWDPRIPRASVGARGGALWSLTDHLLGSSLPPAAASVPHRLAPPLHLEPSAAKKVPTQGDL